MATLYASGATWNANASWGTASGLTDGTIPTSSDDLIFDANSVSMAIDVNATCKSIVTTGGAGNFAQTLTQNSTRTLTVSGNIAWSAGNFVGGDSLITLANGAFTLSGGDFISTSGTFITRLGWTHTAGGAWHHNNGHLSLGNGDYAAGQTINVATTETFYDLTAWAYGGYNLDLSGDTLVVTHAFTHRDGLINNGTIEAQGPIAINANADGGTATINITSAGDQSIAGNSGTTCIFDVNKSSGTLSLGTTNLGIYGLIIRSGNTVNSTTGILMVLTSWTNTAGGVFNHNNGTVQSGSTGLASSGTWNFATSETFYNLRFDRFGTYAADLSGDTAIVTGTLTMGSGNINNGTIQAQGDVNRTADAKGGTAALQFTGGVAVQTYTVTAGGVGMSGTVTVNKSSGKVQSAADIVWNATGQDLVITAGTLDTNGYNLTVNDQISVASGAVFQLNGGETVSYTGITLSGGSNVKYVDASTARTLKNWSYSNLEIAGGAAIVFSLGEAHTGIATLTLTTGIFYIAGYNMTATTFVNNATIRLQGVETVTVTQDTDSGIWEYVGRNVSETITIKDFGAGVDYFNLKINDANGTKATFQLGAALTVAAALDMSAGVFTMGAYAVSSDSSLMSGGTLTLSSTTWTVSGTVSIYGTGTLTLNANSGKLVCAGTVSLAVNTSQSLYDLEIASGTTSTGTSIYVSRNLIRSGGILNGSDTVYVAGNITSTSSAEGTSAIQLNGTGTQTITAGGTNRIGGGLVTINKASGSAVLASALTLNATGQDLTVTAGTLDLAGYALTVADVFTVNAGAALTLTGDEAVTAATVTLNATSTTTYNATSGTRNIKGWDYGHLIFNGAGGTWTMAAYRYVYGNLTVTAGTFAASQNVLVYGTTTVNGGTVNITSGGGGYFSSIGAMTFSSGSVSLNASVLRPYADLTIAAGVFNAGTGLVKTYGTGITRTWDIGTTALYDVTLSASMPLNVTGTVAVTNDLTTNCEFLSGTITVIGNIVATSALGAGLIKWIGTGSKSITTAGTCKLGQFEVNGSGTLTLTANLVIIGAGRDMVFTAGTLDLAGFNLTVPDVFSVASGAVLKVKGTETITTGTRTLTSGAIITYYDGAVTAVLDNINNVPAGVVVHLGATKTHNMTAWVMAGTWEADGALGATASLIRSASGTATLNFTGTSNLADKVDVSNIDASAGDQVEAIGSEDSGGNTNWKFTDETGTGAANTPGVKSNASGNATGSAAPKTPGIKASGAGSATGTGAAKVPGVKALGLGAAMGTASPKVGAPKASGTGNANGSGAAKTPGVKGSATGSLTGTGAAKTPGINAAGSGSATGTGAAKTPGVTPFGRGHATGAGTVKVPGVRVLSSGHTTGTGDAKVPGVKASGSGSATGTGSVKVPGVKADVAGGLFGTGNAKVPGIKASVAGGLYGTADVKTPGVKGSAAGHAEGVGAAKTPGVKGYGLGEAMGEGIVKVAAPKASASGHAVGSGVVSVPGIKADGSGSATGTGSAKVPGVKASGCGNACGVGDVKVPGVRATADGHATGTGDVKTPGVKADAAGALYGTAAAKVPCVQANVAGDDKSFSVYVLQHVLVNVLEPVMFEDV